VSLSGCLAVRAGLHESSLRDFAARLRTGASVMTLRPWLSFHSVLLKKFILDQGRRLRTDSMPLRLTPGIIRVKFDTGTGVVVDASWDGLVRATRSVCMHQTLCFVLLLLSARGVPSVSLVSVGHVGYRNGCRLRVCSWTRSATAGRVSGRFPRQKMLYFTPRGSRSTLRACWRVRT
jgi:hypothetical protein